MEEICLGKGDWRGQPLKESVNDDLESVFENLKLGIEPESDADTFFVPKLTREELKLVDQADQDYFQTFYHFKNPDVKDEEMKLSESNSKYISGYGWRWTYRIDNPVFKDPNSSIESINSVLSASNMSNSNLDEEDADKKPQCHKCNCCCLQ